MLKKLPFLFGVAVTLALLWDVGLQETVNVILKTNLVFFTMALALNVLDEVLAAMILKVALNSPKVAFKEVFLSHISGMLYGDATPGRLGYYYAAFSLSEKTGEKKSWNIGMVTAVQGVYLFTKIIGCLIATAYFVILFGNIPADYTFVYISAIPLVALVGMLLAFYTTMPQRLLEKTPLRSMLEYVHTMQDAFKSISRRNLHKIATLTMLIFLLIGVQWYLLAKSIGVEINFVSALMLRPLLSAVTFIPLTPNGMGFMEGGGVLLFSLMGFDAVDGIAFVLLTRTNQIMVNALGLIDLWYARKRL